MLCWIAVAATSVAHAYFANYQTSVVSPYLSQLRSSPNSAMICQGVLIDPNFALFTRACAENHNEADKVVVGAKRINGGLNDGEWIPVAKKFYSANTSLDFAIVQLARPSTYSPMRILWDDVEPGKRVWLRGWFPFNKDESLKTIWTTKVEIVANDKCQARLNRTVYDYQVCGENENIDMCSWYILGAILAEIDGSEYLVGTLTLYDCDAKPAWQIFNRISAGRLFIEPFLCRGIEQSWKVTWLYGLTIQLPLARKELSMEHVSGMTTSTTPLLPSAEASAMASGGAVLPPRTTESFASNQPLPATPRSSTSPGHHVRSLSSDAAPTTMANPGSSMASATKATLLVRSMSTDLGAVMAGTMQLPPSMLNDTKWKQQQRKLLVSGMAERRAAAVGPMPPSTASSSTKTYHALAAPTTTTTLFEDDPFQRCDGIPRGAIVLDKVHCVKDDDYSDMPSSLTIAPSCGDFICLVKFSSKMTCHSYSRADYRTFSRRSCTLRVGDGESDVELNGWINAICRASFHCYLALPPSPQGKVNQMQAKRSDNEMYKYSSFQYLRETDPLLWEINPLDQTAIRKKAAAAASAPDYAVLFTKYAHVLKHIVLPRPRPISIEQTLRDIIPELFLINNILYGGGDTESIDDIFEVLEGYVRRFAASHDECVHIVSAILQACARTIAGGDSYFVVRTLLGSSSMVIRPAHNHGMPIVIDISSAKPTMFTITLQSAFMFHTVDEIERMDEADEVAPTCRVQTLHVQEIDFETSKSTRHLKIRQVLPDEGEPLDRNSHSSRSVNHDYGALLDGLG
ncbi:hypothetical protein DYB36_002343 [Aphanomyces astaci]|uniref:Peptidase S1 domain-containing protein n=1 Tax=Aphanomyces astaci TaxID=112090 RepID=A0A397AYF7_APHAT|nr:hypothetical protein DYB36_002343 [Aphanomyces astaci]